PPQTSAANRYRNPLMTQPLSALFPAVTGNGLDDNYPDGARDERRTSRSQTAHRTRSSRASPGDLHTPPEGIRRLNRPRVTRREMSSFDHDDRWPTLRDRVT